MVDIGSLIAEASVPCGDVAATLLRLAAQLAPFGAVHHGEAGATFEGRFGRAALHADRGYLSMRAEAGTATELAIMKMTLADQLAALAGPDAPAFHWSDSSGEAARLPYFHELTVVRTEVVTPRRRRVVVAGDVAPLAAGGLHVRVLIPPPGIAPVWPMQLPDGRIDWPSGEAELTPRVYTLRSVDVAAGEATIDVVQHDGASTPGSDWARNALPGDRVGLLGPGGAAPVPADRLLLVGDETAVPAIARVLATLPATAHATVRLEVADRGEVQRLPTAASLDLEWLCRDGAAAGTTTLIETAVAAVDWHRGGLSCLAWGGCEQTVARTLRRQLVTSCGLAKADLSIAAYWRRGSSGVEASA